MRTKIGRNEPCYCGSEKKYKHCHLNKENGSTWEEIASKVVFEHDKKDVIDKTFFAINSDFKRYPNAGSCHLLSGIMHLLLMEQGLESTLCIGEVEHVTQKYCFDHSWVEINYKPFDIAIQLGLDEQKKAPVYAGFDLDTGKPTAFNYRFKGKGLGGVAKSTLASPFVDYMDGAGRLIGWDAVKRIGKSIGLMVDIEDLRERYKDVKRIIM